MHVVAPVRVRRSYVQHLEAPPASVFPLLCPVRESDWIEDWAPSLVISESGVAEADCVFVTPGSPADAVWYVTRHEPDHAVEMIRIAAGVTACRLSIELRPSGTGTAATVTYAHTSLGPAGDRVVAEFTEAAWRTFMETWERRLNHYLAHGTMLR